MIELSSYGTRIAELLEECERHYWEGWAAYRFGQPSGQQEQAVKAWERLAAYALAARRELIGMGWAKPTVGPELFAAIRELGVKWNVEMPVFRTREDGTVETLLFSGTGRSDNYRGKHFVPGAQQGRAQSPEEVLATVCGKIGATPSRCRFVGIHFSRDDPVAPLLNLVYATSETVFHEGAGEWYPRLDLPASVPDNHRRLIQMGYQSFVKTT